jgi:hypothetical protein
MAKGLDRKWHDAARFIGSAEICPEECRTSSVAANLFDQEPPFAQAPPRYNYFRAQLRHTSRSGSANAASSTGDECDFVGRNTVLKRGP